MINRKEALPPSPLQAEAEAAATAKEFYERVFAIGH
jgi:hypothetical protein